MRRNASISGQLFNLHRTLVYGCGNGGCVILKPKGQHTNMICQCTPDRIAKALLNIACEVEKLDRNWEDKEEK